ncbi:SufD family Fe-S cluster assembly protein [Candidatus Roizmanbacteria bacterium]|nr:SufD family Fe-S cluster assembly protein [Candidatus Roizmanbacteria bacterium]
MQNISGDFTFEIKASDVDLDIYGLFFGKGNDEFQVHTTQRHAAPSSKSNLFIKGVFDDESRFHYQGLIKIEKEGQHTHAYQKNQNLILSPKTFIESEPFLEILANDVFCTHGSTTGKLSEEELYYLKTRGIKKEQARKLLIAGFLNEILQKLPHNHISVYA